MVSDIQFPKIHVDMKGFKTVRVCFLILILLVVTSSAAQADTTQAPLYLLLKTVVTETSPDDTDLSYLDAGDLWKWTGDIQGKLSQVSHWHYNGAPVISPDGNHIAYQSIPQITLDYLKSDASHAEGVVTGALPFNLWILDTQTDQAKRINEQNPSASIDFAHYDLANGITRSAPVWSPDSSKIIWIEADSSAAMMATDASQFVPRLMSYDLATGQTAILSDHLALPNYASPQAGGTAIGVMTPRWFSENIAVGYVGSADKNTYAIYDLTGQLQNELEQAHNDLGVLTYIVIHDNQQDYLAISDTDGWSLYDPKTAKSSTLEGRIEGYSLVTAQGLTLRDDGNAQWELVDAHDRVQALDNCFIDYTKVSIAIAPDGKQAACYTDGDDTVSIYTESGLLTQIPVNNDQFVSMSWGSMGWRVAHNTP